MPVEKRGSNGLRLYKGDATGYREGGGEEKMQEHHASEKGGKKTPGRGVRKETRDVRRRVEKRED